MLRNQFTKIRSHLYHNDKRSPLIKEIDNILEGCGLHQKTEIDISNVRSETLEELISIENKINALEKRNNKRLKRK